MMCIVHRHQRDFEIGVGRSVCGDMKYTEWVCEFAGDSEVAGVRGGG